MNTHHHLLLKQFAQWQAFQQQQQLNQEHAAALQKLAASGAMANRLLEAYRSMARQAEHGACYRTLFRRALADNEFLTCEAWMRIDNINASGGMSLVEATFLISFDLLAKESIDEALIGPESITLELFDCISIQQNFSLSCQVDRQDQPNETHFITYLDQVRNYNELIQNIQISVAD